MEMDIEKNVIGSLILKPKFFMEVSEIINEEDFNIDLYRHAFKTMRLMVRNGSEIEITNLFLEMGRPGTAGQLAESFDDCIFDPSYYARVLKKRNLENSINDAAKNREYEEIQKKVIELKGLGKPVELSKITEIIEKGEKRNEVIPTGYRHFDSIVQLQRTDLMILAGYTSVGKSLLGCAMLANMAQDNTVGLISFEMSDFKIVKRLCYAFDNDYINSINQSFLISTPAPFTIQTIRKTLQDMVLKKNIKVVLIDYLQLMSEPKNYQSRHLEISYIIRSLKELAKEFNVAMIVISSLSRKEKSDNTEPVLSDLKESGDIEYASDVVCFLWRKKNELDADLIIAKNRNGKLNIIKLDWNSQKIRYDNHFWQE